MVTIEEIIQHPLFLLLVGAVITSLIIPWFTKRWQDDRAKTEIKEKLTTEMSELAATTMGKIYSAIATSPEFDVEKRSASFKEFETLFTRSYAIRTKLRAYFPNSTFARDWIEYNDLSIDFLELALGHFTKNSDEVQNKIIQRMRRRLKEDIKMDFEKLKTRDSDHLHEISGAIMRQGDDLIGEIIKTPINKI